MRAQGTNTFRLERCLIRGRFLKEELKETYGWGRDETRTRAFGEFAKDISETHQTLRIWGCDKPEFNLNRAGGERRRAGGYE